MTEGWKREVYRLEQERDEARKWARFYRQRRFLMPMEPEPDWLTAHQPASGAAEEGER